MKSQALIEDEKRMRGLVPVFSQAFRDAAELVFLNLKEEEAKKWTKSVFYKMCINAKKAIFANSSEMIYNVRWKNNNQAEKYEILVFLKDHKKVKLTWESWKVRISLSKKGKKIEQRAA